jgi:predicted enzyme related to lactoylglutathione lyase
MTTDLETGRFVWHDLMTTDLETSVKFHTQLFGWTTKEVDSGGPSKYTMIQLGASGIGGFIPLDRNLGVPSHWIGYLTVDDVDRRVAKAKEHGAQVHVEATDIPGTGRFAVICDPTGAVVSPFKLAKDDVPEPEGMPAVGDFCWDELMTTDPHAAAKFYADLVGWTTEEMDMGEGGKYLMMKRGDVMAAGMMKMPPGVDAPPHWLSYIHVADVDASTTKARELGATIHGEPRDIPEIGRFSVLQDPAGAVIALFRSVKA